MTARSVTQAPGRETGPRACNEVRLVGRLAAVAELRVLPSGDELLSLRLVVDRPAPSEGFREGSRRAARLDTLDCAVWAPRLRRTVATSRAGDWVEVTGAVRRRFFRSPAGAVSRVEIEVDTARVIRRAAS